MDGLLVDVRCRPASARDPAVSADRPWSSCIQRILPPPLRLVGRLFVAPGLLDWAHHRRVIPEDQAGPGPGDLKPWPDTVGRDPERHRAGGARFAPTARHPDGPARRRNIISGIPAT